MDNLRLKVENMVAKVEIARFEQFLVSSLCFQKAVCCRGVRKSLYEDKCKPTYVIQLDPFTWTLKDCLDSISF